MDVHKTHPQDFIRKPILTFEVIFVIMLRKGLKSLQLSLNEFIPKLNLSEQTVSNMAYCKARRKLKHTAFIELNKAAVVETMYEDGDYQTYEGFRLLGVDGSKIQLPDTEETEELFGTLTYANKVRGTSGQHSFALASVLYDVLNKVALDAQLLPARTYEVTAAMRNLDSAQLTAEDIIIADRNYHSPVMMAAILRAGSNFLIRCKRGSGMAVADDMLAGKGDDDRIVTVTIPKHLREREEYKSLDMPISFSVRFVRVLLDTGEYEVLATSILDNTVLPTESFKELYYLRWGIETFYGLLKTRLTLENFTGYSVDAIRQDFFATVFLCGIEAIFTMDAEETLRKQKGGKPKKVNKAVSFNAIKYRAFELFLSDMPEAEILKELDDLFLTSPTLIRPERKPKRKRHADNKVLDYFKRVRKAVF